MSDASAHVALRAQTHPCHEAVDRAFGRFDLADRTSYRDFLTAHARALPAAEAMLADHPGLPPFRPRASLLADDLTAMGASPPMALPLDPPADQAEAFGMLYVIEGSRLGGGMLARAVPGDLPRAYLSAVHLSGEWRAFCATLDRAAAEGDAAWLERAAHGARRAFTLYERAANA